MRMKAAFRWLRLDRELRWYEEGEGSSGSNHDGRP
jgi:hypothetical protein